MSTYTNSPRRAHDFDGADSSEAEDKKQADANGSDEDTADASETEDKSKNSSNHLASNTGQRTEIKEQMYQDKLAHIKKQIGMLEEGSLPDFSKEQRKLSYSTGRDFGRMRLIKQLKLKEWIQTIRLIVIMLKKNLRKIEKL
uniref:Uncharacterized protein n=1 Tax=Arion vulgaris TaxID=1028688 RepID=A0A0B7ARA2_9EUPU